MVSLHYLCDVVKVSEDAELFRLQFGLEMSSDDGNVVNDELQAAGSQCYEHTTTNTSAQDTSNVPSYRFFLFLASYVLKLMSSRSQSTTGDHNDHY